MKNLFRDFKDNENEWLEILILGIYVFMFRDLEIILVIFFRG